MENKNRITVTQLAIMTTVAVASLRSLPAMATAGWSSITQWLIPAIMFFVPTALVGAELGTKFKGGVFEWVKEAYGERLGFLAVWLQWIQNVVWYPTSSPWSQGRLLISLVWIVYPILVFILVPLS
ncbi:amino acid permease [Lactococcus fujiensis]|uniref:amino acid permease n=1 Tax=Lactococcus fujiensis TaxID=610251 RepID=UPI000AFC2977|nr:amino acid permease [Lactococcus fujiensis]